MLTRTAKSCGPDAPTLASSLAEVQPPNRVGMRRISVRRRWQKSPDTRARRKPLKPLRAGTPGDSGVLVVTRVRSTTTSARRGCHGHPAFPTPSMGGRFINASGASPGEVANSRLRFDVFASEAVCSLPPCGEELERGVATSTDLAAYPPP